MICSSCNSYNDSAHSFCLTCGRASEIVRDVNVSACEAQADKEPSLILIGGVTIALAAVLAVSLEVGRASGPQPVTAANQATTAPAATHTPSPQYGVKDEAGTRVPATAERPRPSEFNTKGNRLRAVCKNGEPSYWQYDAWATCGLKGGVAWWNPEHPANK
ncbi:MAG: hypothetical protein KF736_09945 [Acidobacteria bacterium]|nr:hypothetical protein [Acidobacteriota bacterium]MCW5949820.1 hypothetical protein [Pyrinomonadaceae bacterium]